ncbi:MAG: hypothetical protein M1834_003409 [Cirrosporium novae-zelandiae]|nr:MAG: hypothetical protein M1834_003409 [Cirrosporium novae-zelandiae]
MNSSSSSFAPEASSPSELVDQVWSIAVGAFKDGLEEIIIPDDIKDLIGVEGLRVLESRFKMAIKAKPLVVYDIGSSSTRLMRPAVLGRPIKYTTKRAGTTKIPRPPNAFILYRQHHHPQVKKNNPGLHNNQISIILGQQWRNESLPVKQMFERQARDLKAKHLIDHPQYQYCPRKPSEKKRRMTARKLAAIAAAATDAKDSRDTTAPAKGQVGTTQISGTEDIDSLNFTQPVDNKSMAINLPVQSDDLDLVDAELQDLSNCHNFAFATKKQEAAAASTQPPPPPSLIQPPHISNFGNQQSFINATNQYYRRMNIPNFLPLSGPSEEQIVESMIDTSAIDWKQAEDAVFAADTEDNELFEKFLNPEDVAGRALSPLNLDLFDSEFLRTDSDEVVPLEDTWDEKSEQSFVIDLNRIAISVPNSLSKPSKDYIVLTRSELTLQSTVTKQNNSLSHSIENTGVEHENLAVEVDLRREKKETRKCEEQLIIRATRKARARVQKRGQKEITKLDKGKKLKREFDASALKNRELLTAEIEWRKVKKMELKRNGGRNISMVKPKGKDLDSKKRRTLYRQEKEKTKDSGGLGNSAHQCINTRRPK